MPETSTCPASVRVPQSQPAGPVQFSAEFNSGPPASILRASAVLEVIKKP
jgi:hypothetical protein